MEFMCVILGKNVEKQIKSKEQHEGDTMEALKHMCIPVIVTVNKKQMNRNRGIKEMNTTSNL